jgi:hypothetical protein
MIESKKGLNMYESVSPIYERNELMQSIFEAIGSEADLSEKQIDDIRNQIVPQTATWGLDIWEQRLGLITNHNEDIKIRRAKIIAKIQSKYIINPKRMENMIQNFVDADIDIEENVAPYVFEVDLLSENGFPNDLKDLYATVKKIKPSHLGVIYKLIAITQTNLYIAALSFEGEVISTYPWTPNDIESQTELYIPMVNYSNLETIVTYPKED